MPCFRARQFLAAFALVCLAPGALAQTPPSDTIVVTARTPEQAQAFVEQLSAAPAGADQLARWDNTICMSIAGLPQRQGQFLADQIARRAMALGLTPGQPGCRANLSVIVAEDSNLAAQRLREEEASLFGYRQDGSGVTMGREALEDFLTSSRAVRWWHVAQTVTADGMSLDGDASMGGAGNAPTARSSGSRLRADVRQDLNRAIVIVDARRVAGVQLAQLADYVALVALAQVNPRADTAGYPTILNLFADDGQRAVLTGMTEWDVTFLQGLYSATRNAANVHQQRREIARRMVEGAPGA